MLAGLILISSFPSTAVAADDYLLSVEMNPTTTWDSSNLLPLDSQLKQVRYQIPRDNPDKLIAQIVFKKPLAAKRAIPDSKWILGIWLYAPSLYCFNSSSCNYILEIQPSYGGQANVYRHTNKIDSATRVLSDCKAPWYTKNDANGDSIIAFELSITCLNISSSFASYAFSSYDIGLDPRPWQFTTPNYIDNPYLQLAEKSYLANGGKNGLGTVVGTPDVENFKKSVESTREVFDSMMDRYQGLALETQSKLDRNTEWKNFLKSEDELIAIEDNLETYGFSTNAEKLKGAVALQKLINLKTKALQLQLKVIPQYQCNNEAKGILKALGKAKSCPKGFKKVTT